MTEHISILRRAGWTLVAMGALDIGVMIYCIANGLSYSSSLNVFAVIAGIFLLRGSLKAAQLVTRCVAFLLAALSIGAVVVLPWVLPMDYWMRGLREDPFSSLLTAVLLFVLLYALFWVYKTLRAPAVVEALVAAGQRAGAPKSAFLAGGALALVMAVLLHFTLNGDSAKQAVRVATEQYGSEYKYFVKSINWTSRHVSARLTAYNDKESKEVRVEWEN